MSLIRVVGGDYRELIFDGARYCGEGYINRRCGCGLPRLVRVNARHGPPTREGAMALLGIAPVWSTDYIAGWPGAVVEVSDDGTDPIWM